MASATKSNEDFNLEEFESLLSELNEEDLEKINDYVDPDVR